MIFSPLSEIPYIGRNPVYITTLFIFVMLQIPTALASNFSMLLAFRFLTGFFGSPVLATGGATIADMYFPNKRAYAMAIWGIAAVSGPTMGPMVGGFAAQAKGWTWTIWELMWASGFAFVFLFFFLPETSAANILYRRTKRLRKKTGDDKLTCEPEMMAESMTPNEIIMMALVRPITLNFTEPMVFLLNLYIALVYGLLYIWFESFPIVFVELYHFNLGEEGLAFLGILFGALITIPPFFWYLHKYIEPKFNENGEIKPESRLPAACVGAFFIPICLFWFGWSSRASIHWIVPIIGSAFFSVAALLLFNSVLNYLTDAYPDYVASVLAGNDLFRSGFGAGFPLFASAMYKRLGVAWASSLLAFLGVAFIPIPFVLYIVSKPAFDDSNSKTNIIDPSTANDFGR
jgi:DHA1 family multidrug resistance protein-like MFS transporter